MKKILVLNGPNLNCLGERETDIYGSLTLEEINLAIKEKAKALKLQVECLQSNHEGELVSAIQEAPKKFNGIIINPAAYTHTSIAIRDALLGINLPTLEVHLSNIYKREPFRHHSYIAAAVRGQISGLGVEGYLLALEAMAKWI